MLRKQIAAAETGSLYMLVGDDDVEMSAFAGEFADIVDEGLRAFNVDRLYGDAIKIDDLVDAWQDASTVGNLLGTHSDWQHNRSPGRITGAFRRRTP